MNWSAALRQNSGRFFVMTFFKADYITGRLMPVEGKKFANEVIAIGNSRYKLVGESIFTPHASYHLSYYSAKDALMKALNEKLESATKEVKHIEEMIIFASSNF